MNDKKKYYIRGLGCGLLIATVILMITKSIRFTDEKAVKRAKELGYVLETQDDTKTIDLNQIKENLEKTPAPTTAPKETTPVPTKAPTEAVKPTDEIKPTQTPTNEPKATEKPENPDGVKTAIINVTPGMICQTVCDMCQEMGIVESAEDFMIYSQRRGLTEDFNVGRFEVRSDMTYDQLLHVFTGK